MLENTNVKTLDRVVVRFAGDSGDGMQLAGNIFSNVSAGEGNQISTFPDYPAEIRAPQGSLSGVSGFQVHIGRGVHTPGDQADVLVAMNPAALKTNLQFLKSSGIIICDVDKFQKADLEKAQFATDDPVKELGIDPRRIMLVQMTSLVKHALADSGMDMKSILKSRNMFALGLICWLFDRPLDSVLRKLQAKFAKKPAVYEANAKVIRAGWDCGHNTHSSMSTYRVETESEKKGTYTDVSGNTATAWGLIMASQKSGLPLFLGSYPITPATDILHELAKRKDLGVKTVQAEDEIAGICTAIGAAYAGDFAVTTTSGPGLSLKSEAMGLAVMAELPIVIVDVQRGGPSTGLPTKTEQSDLMQALYGRNGECPVVVIAASSPSDCFHYAFMAGKIALEHMTPVILLTDGFIANGSEPWRIPSMQDYPAIVPPIVNKAPEEGEFMPYKRDERLVRGWAFPGKKGLEHRIGGLEKDHLKGSISYDPANHQEMVLTRAAKVARVADDLPTPTIDGAADADLLVIGWGGTRGHLQTAVDDLKAEGKSIAHLHLNYIYPLPKGLRELLEGHKHIIVCELNEGQMAAYLRQNFQEFNFEQYNKCEGQPFTVAELKEKFVSLL